MNGYYTDRSFNCSCNEVWVLDLECMNWTLKDIQGVKPHARYGHSQVGCSRSRSGLIINTVQGLPITVVAFLCHCFRCIFFPKQKALSSKNCVLHRCITVIECKTLSRVTFDSNPIAALSKLVNYCSPCFHSSLCYPPYSRILHYWIDSEAAPANGGSGM